MRTINYVKESIKRDMWLSEFMVIEKETKQLDKSIRNFINFVAGIEGGISKTWLVKNKLRMKDITKKYYALQNLIGRTTLRGLIATNVFSLYIQSEDPEVHRAKDNLMNEFMLDSHDDLDLRYLLKNRDYFIFWQSILFIMVSLDEV